jgi:two-component system chemotaxis response regulator CheY
MLDRITYEYPDIQVVMCSGHNTLENVKQTWEMGAKGFVSKPFNEHKVAAILKRLERV